MKIHKIKSNAKLNLALNITGKKKVLHKIENPNIKMIFDLANFYKNSKNYEKAIDRYTEIILTLDDNSLIKSDVLYRRGGSYERMGNYEKSDEDLLHALKLILAMHIF